MDSITVYPEIFVQRKFYGFHGYATVKFYRIKIRVHKYYSLRDE